MGCGFYGAMGAVIPLLSVLTVACQLRASRMALPDQEEKCAGKTHAHCKRAERALHFCGVTGTASDADTIALQYFLFLHSCHDELDQSSDRFVHIGGIKGVGDPSPNQLPIRRRGIIKVGFNARLLFLSEVAG
jgi:hypothetical protein